MRKNHLVLILMGFLLIGLLVFAGPGDGSDGNGSKDAVGLQYLSPRPGAELVLPQTTIAFRFDSADLVRSNIKPAAVVRIQIVGNVSGAHRGELVVGGDGETVIFRPQRPFAFQEEVTVGIESLVEGRPFSYEYSFFTAPPEPVISEAERWPDLLPPSPVAGPLQTVGPPAADPLPDYRTVPQDFPNLDVYAAPGTGDGYVFLSHFNFSNVSNGRAYLLMLDENGEPVYYNRLHPLPAAFDFKKQPNGFLTYFDVVQKLFVALDNRYNPAGSYQTGNGYQTDLHDMQILGNNHALMLIYDYKIIDMSLIVPGGNPAALVVGCILQEIDTQGNVVFEWRSWDHIPITDSNQDLTADFIRYIHCNSIEPDSDGNLLMSSRHLDEVTKIDRQTGEIIWRLGGKANQFTFTNDPGFFYQHDARRLANGRLSLYDNRTYQEPLYSRAVEYWIDEQAMTATRLFEYRHNPDVFGGAMGNYQRLPGGNILVAWGWSSVPVLTEARADGTTVFELSADDRFGTYRAFRFSWQGFPTWPPQLLGYAEERTISLYFSHNGATEIVGYHIYGGTDPLPTTLLATVARDGYETTFTYEAPTDGLYYFRVLPFIEDGTTTQYSNIMPIFVGGKPVFLPFVGRE